MTPTQYAAQTNAACGTNPVVGYSPWGPGPSQHQFVENFYNNPIQYPTNGSNNGAHRYQPPPPPLPNANGTCYQQHQQTSKSCHSHYPSSHPHSVEYQPYHSNGGNRKCGNTRMCASFDALSPQQAVLPNPANWQNPVPKTNGTHNHKCTKQNSQQQLYQCSSECSDHSLKSHSQNSHSSQERSKNSNCKENCHQRTANNKNHHALHQNGHTKPTGSHCPTANGTDILNGNDNIYENDDETTENDQMLGSTTNQNTNYATTVSETDRHSDCCSSVGEGDTCCSCSESSCLYAEAVDPAPSIAPSQSTSSNQLAKLQVPTPTATQN